MIKNIPNKYDMTMLSNELMESFEGKFDFLYLPLDFENKCNLGYAFINFIDPLHILMLSWLYEGKRWKVFNSFKECKLSFAKIQGKSELTAHLEKSCIMSKLEYSKKPIIITIKKPYPKVSLPSKYYDFVAENYTSLERFVFI